jgi:hypothetical protein
MAHIQEGEALPATPASCFHVAPWVERGDKAANLAAVMAASCCWMASLGDIACTVS